MIDRIRSTAGPAMVAVGVWCAAGVVTLQSPADPGVRLVAPAPWWCLLLAFIAALFVPAWRRHPARAAPALLATLPWWPLPLPAVGLFWTGVLGWIPVGLVLWIACAPSTPARPPAAVSRPRRTAALAALLTLPLVVLTAWSVRPWLPSGDEPHYLVITQSLLNDHSLRIEPTVTRRDYAAYYTGSLSPAYLRRGRDQAIYSIHAPGLPALVLPAFAVFGYRGAQATLMLLAAVTGGLIWALGWEATEDRRAAWFAWLAIVGTSTFLFQAVTIYPDMPGTAVSAAAILLLLVLDRRPARVGLPALAAVSCGLAALPWLHTRFVVLAVGFSGLIVWKLLTDRGRPVRLRAQRVALFLAVPALGAAAWFGYFLWIYGTPNPTAPYGADPGTRAAYAPGGVLGLLFDSQFGLFAYAPVLALACLRLGRRAGWRTRGVSLGVALVAGAYLLAVGTYWQWWAGLPAPPARFATAVLPALAIPLAVVWARARSVGRAISALLLTGSVAVTAVLVGVNRGLLAWNVRGTAPAWFSVAGSVVDLSRAWPSFFWRLVPGVVASEASFAEHVALVLLVFVGGLVCVRRYARGRAVETGQARLAAVSWVTGSAMVAAALGWVLLGATGLDASRSGVALLGAVAEGQRTWRVSAASIRPTDGRPSFWIPVDRSDRSGDGPAPWDALDDVPAGTYAFRVHTRAPVGGTLAFRVGDSTAPFRTLTLPAVSDQTVSLSVPVGVRVLALEPSPGLAASATRVDFSALAVPPGRGPAAERTAEFGPVEVFFLDDHVFVEDQGFWVRGGSRTALVLMAPPESRAVDLRISNGPRPNTLGIDVGAGARESSLDRNASREIDVPLSASGVGRVEITSTASFRPADGGTSTDQRELGVRVTVGPAPQ